MAIRFKHLYNQVNLVILSKIEEFRYYGYYAITEQQLWNFCLDKKWHKKEVEQLHLHEIVATIYETKASDIMNYEQIRGLRSTQARGLLKEELGLFLYLSTGTEEVD